MVGSPECFVHDLLGHTHRVLGREGRHAHLEEIYASKANIASAVVDHLDHIAWLEQLHRPAGHIDRRSQIASTHVDLYASI